jgi:hypothetical protein
MSPLIFGSDFLYGEGKEISRPDKLYLDYESENDIAIFNEIGKVHPRASYLRVWGYRNKFDINLDSVKRIPISDENFSSLSNMLNLEEIALHCIPFKGNGLHFLSSQKLNRIHISKCTIEDELFTSFSNLTNLRDLVINNYFQTLLSPDLGHLSANSALYSCDFTGCFLSNESFDRFPELPKLEWIALENNNITGENFHFLAYLPKLSSLRLDKCPLTLQGIEVIAQNASQKFSSLSLMDCPNACDEWISRLSTMKQIKSLYLNNSSITDAALPFFQEMKNLEFLNLHGTKFSLDACKTLHNTCHRMTLVLPNGKDVDSKRQKRIERENQ